MKNRAELVLLVGIMAFIYLVIIHGIQWAIDYTLSLFVAITIVYYVREKLWGSEVERI